jgi:hypothetical protein
MDDTVTDFLIEAVDEAAGISSKKWALVLAALVAGAAIALWLTRRPTGDTPTAVESDAPV